MLKKLRLSRFKNFSETELILGPLTLLVGENASGKSNIRDAFRFLHAISRGYTLPDIMGEKWGEGGVLQWKGIRGGNPEIAFQGAETFALEAEFTVKPSDEQQTRHQATYRIEVNPGANGQAPRVVDEKLFVDARPIFELRCPAQDNSQLFLNVPTGQKITVNSQQPALRATEQLDFTFPLLEQTFELANKDRATEQLEHTFPLLEQTFELASRDRATEQLEHTFPLS
jgi:hypothetical protein